MELEFLNYSLKFKRAPNRLKNREKHGVLLRNRNGGFMDYMPWEEFGDDSVKKFLDNLRKENMPTFVSDTLKLNVNEIPIISFHNHGFYPDTSKAFVKIKYLGDLDELFDKVKNTSVKLRIDFNFGLSLKDWETFLNRVGPFKEKIDFIEDPFDGYSFDPKSIPVAADFGIHHNKEQIKVYKPLRESKPEAKRIIYSNSMGHPLGLYLCYLHFVTDTVQAEEYHGLLAPDIYQNYEFIFKEVEQDRYQPDKNIVEKILNNLDEALWTPLK